MDKRYIEAAQNMGFDVEQDEDDYTFCYNNTNLSYEFTITEGDDPADILYKLYDCYDPEREAVDNYCYGWLRECLDEAEEIRDTLEKLSDDWNTIRRDIELEERAKAEEEAKAKAEEEAKAEAPNKVIIETENRLTTIVKTEDKFTVTITYESGTKNVDTYKAEELAAALELLSFMRHGGNKKCHVVGANEELYDFKIFDN